MKRTSLLLGLVLVVFGGAVAVADEPHLQFIQGLRDRRFPDLAREYLEKMQANPPAELAPILPLELAKTRLEMATLEADAARRTALFQQARNEFETFLMNNPGHPLAANANLEIARVIGFLAKGKLSESKRQETAALQKSMAVAARAMFVEAATKLKDASTQIKLKLDTLPEPATTPQDKAAKRALTQAKLEAEFERAMNLLDQSETYRDDLLKRSDVVKEANNNFTKLADLVKEGEARNPLCWLAKAYAGRCYQNIDSPDEANKQYNAVLAENGDHAEAAKRLVLYFKLLLVHNDRNEKSPFDTIKKQGEEWLKNYRRYQFTPEGFGVRWEVGCAAMDLAKKVPPGPDKKPTKAALQLYKEAETNFKLLSDTDNDYTARARQFRMQIILTTAIQQGDDPDKFTKFEQCYIRAQYEAYLIEEDQKKFEEWVAQLPPMRLEAQEAEYKKRKEELPTKRKQHYQTVLRCLERGLVLAATEADVPEADVNDVRSMQSYVHLVMGHTYEAAILGEQMARKHPQSVRASAAAGYALQAYAQIIAKAESGGMMEERELNADRKCLRRLADYIEKTWPNDTATDFARHQLAALLLKDNVYPQAVEVLGRISPNYGGSTQAKFQMALTALDLATEANKLGDLTKEALERSTPVLFGAAAGGTVDQVLPQILERLVPQTTELRKKYYHDKAVEALESIPDATGDSDAETSQYYLLSKLRLGQMLFDIAKNAADEGHKTQDPMAKAALLQKSDQRFNQMEALGDNLAKLAPGLELTDQAKKDILPAVGALSLYAKYGKAEAAFKANDLTKVLAITEPAAADTKKALDDGTLGDDKFGGLRRGLIGLALRANVQQGKTNRAMELLNLLQKAAAADPTLTGGATGVLVQLIQELRDQIELMTKDPVLEKQAGPLKDSIVKVLDALSETKDLPPETTLFLASSYANLDRSDKAKDLLDKAQLPNPGEFEQKPPRQLTAAEEKDQEKVDKFRKDQEAYETAQRDHQRKKQVYQAFALLRIRVLRQDANTFTGKEREDNLKSALAKMDELMTKEAWAKNNLEAIKEQIQIIEDMGAYAGQGGAILRWDALMKKMNTSNPREREQYFDCYYHLVYCFFKNGLKISEPLKRDAMIKRAATFMVKMEGSQPNMGADFLRKKYVDLLKKEKLLKDMYLQVAKEENNGGKLLEGETP